MTVHASARVAGRVVLVATVTLLVLEIGARAHTGSLLSCASRDTRAYGRLDPVQGHVPLDGLAVRVDDEYSITTVAHGVRSNGRVGAAERPLTLVTGDSYAWGDGVHDGETWPAYLEASTGRRVVNAAVPGFGLDQSVLRAEVLGRELRPDVVVVSFIAHDVRRCEMSIWSGIAKPYFEIHDGALVPHPPPEPVPLRAFAPVLSHSALVDLLFHDRLEIDGPDTVVHRDGADVACLLMARLASLRDELGARVIVVAQPQTPLPDVAHYGALDPALATDTELIARVLSCASDHGLATLDLVAPMAALPAGERDSLFRHGRHNSPEGNAWVAGHVGALLATSRDGLPSRLEPPRVDVP